MNQHWTAICIVYNDERYNRRIQVMCTAGAWCCNQIPWSEAASLLKSFSLVCRS